MVIQACDRLEDIGVPSEAHTHRFCLFQWHIVLVSGSISPST